jgi:hypothetical protein
MLVCHTWAQILRDGSLLETVELSVTTKYQVFHDKFNSLAKMAKDGPGRKCNRFVCINDSNRRIKVTTLASSFPNLNFIHLREHIIRTVGDPFSHGDTESDPFQGWRNNLESFYSSCFIENYILDFLFTGIFPRLTTLTVFCTNLLDCDLKTKDLYRKLISKLDNMPALITLIIKSEDLSIVDLEELHKRAPGLVSLTLREGFCVELEDITSLDIAPAENLKVFKTEEFYSDGPVIDTLLKYAKLKYTHLDEYYHYETHHRHNFTMSAPVFSNSIWNDFIPAIGPGLKKCTITLKHKAANIFSPMEMYMDQLESLNVDVFHFRKMYKKVMSKPAFLGLHSLVLRQLPYDFEMSDFKQLTKLHELTLDLSRNSTMYDDGQLFPVTLNSIAKLLPKNVETLKLTFANVTIDEEPVQDISSLTSLSLYDSHVVDQRTSDYLTRYFPKLKSLVLHKSTTIYSLHLPTHHLSYFEFVPHFRDLGIDTTPENIKRCELENTHMEITAQGQTLHYKVLCRENRFYFDPYLRVMEGHDSSANKVLRPIQYDEEFEYFHFTCAAVDTAYYYSYQLL